MCRRNRRPHTRDTIFSANLMCPNTLRRGLKSGATYKFTLSRSLSFIFLCLFQHTENKKLSNILLMKLNGELETITRNFYPAICAMKLRTQTARTKELCASINFHCHCAFVSFSLLFFSERERELCPLCTGSTPNFARRTTKVFG